MRFGYNDDIILNLCRVNKNHTYFAHNINIADSPPLDLVDRVHNSILHIAPEGLHDIAFTPCVNQSMEMAVQMAKLLNNKQKVMIFSNSSEYIKLAVGKECIQIQFPNLASSNRLQNIMDKAEQQCLQQIIEAFQKESISSIIIEPIRENDYCMFSNLFMHHLQDACKLHKVPVIVDENNCGVNISGKAWAHELWYQEYVN